MAENIVNATGDVVTVIAPSSVTSGQSLLVGDLFGVCLASAASGATVALQVEGIVTLRKASGTINPGVRVFWDNSAGRITTTATNNRCIGWHVGQVANSGADNTDILVKLGGPNAVAA